MEPVPSEYAIMLRDGDGWNDFRIVRCRHRLAWTSIRGNEDLQMLCELGADGFELVIHQV